MSINPKWIFAFLAITLVHCSRDSETTAKSSGTTRSNVLTSDSFNRTDSTTQLGTSASNSTDAAAGGTAFAYTIISGGVMGITSGKAYATALGGSGAGAMFDSGKTACSLQIKVTTQSAAGIAGLLFRSDSTGADNVYGFLADQSGATLGSAGYHMIKNVAAATTLIGSNTAVIPTDGDVMRVVYSGSSIIAKVNGTAVLTLTDSDLPSTTYVGFGQNVDMAARFDDLLVEDCQ